MAESDRPDPRSCPHSKLRKEGTQWICHLCLSKMDGVNPRLAGTAAPAYSDKITEKQANFLGNLLRATDLDLDAAIDGLNEEGCDEPPPEAGAVVTDLKKKYASKLIDYLVRVKEEGPSQQRDPGRRPDGYGPASGNQSGLGDRW